MDLALHFVTLSRMFDWAEHLAISVSYPRFSCLRVIE